MNPVLARKRTVKRSRTFLTAHVQSGLSSVEARIRDVSKSGALLESDEPPAAGDEVRITCGSFMAIARVAWSEGPWFGIEFASALARGVLVDDEGASLRVAAPRTYRSSDAFPIN
jgi:hypothetical protein